MLFLIREPKAHLASGHPRRPLLQSAWPLYLRQAFAGLSVTEKTYLFQELYIETIIRKPKKVGLFGYRLSSSLRFYRPAYEAFLRYEGLDVEAKTSRRIRVLGDCREQFYQVSWPQRMILIKDLNTQEGHVRERERERESESERERLIDHGSIFPEPRRTGTVEASRKHRDIFQGAVNTFAQGCATVLLKVL